MKRWLLSLAVLVGWTVSVAYADFVLIRAVLGGKRDANNPNAPGGGTAAPGAPGGPPGRGPGGPGGPINPPNPNTPTFGQTIDPNALTVQAIVLARPKAPAIPNMVITRYTRLPNGITRLYNDGQTLFSIPLPMRSNKTEFERRRANVFKARTSDKVLDLAEWSLTHGLLDEYAKLMEDLATNKEDESASASAALKNAVQAFKTIKETIDKPVTRDDQANYWKIKLGGMRYEQSKHYTLFYNSPISNPPEVESRLALLEAHMKGFYYWFAMKGVALPMPADKLVCVLLDQPNEFKLKRAVEEDEPLVADSFFAQRDNVCVFSKERLDGPYQAFIKQTLPIYQSGFDRAALLDGTAKMKAGMSRDDMARYQTLALLEKSLEEEGERAAVSHDGVRQLLVAVGLMPRNVVVPQWAMFGTAAFFETPKGPFQDAPEAAKVAFYPGIGAPSWAYLRPFKTMEAQKKFPAESQLLREVVTDTHFHQVINAQDRQGLMKARTTAWALGYYLAKVRLSGLMRYCQELSALPRDLEMSDRALLAAFARAFDVANATQDGIDPQKFDELAKNWVAYIKGVTSPGAEFGLDREIGTGTPGQPGQPGMSDPGQGGGPSGVPKPGGKGPGGSG